MANISVVRRFLKGTAHRHGKEGVPRTEADLQPPQRALNERRSAQIHQGNERCEASDMEARHSQGSWSQGRPNATAANLLACCLAALVGMTGCMIPCYLLVCLCCLFVCLIVYPFAYSHACSTAYLQSCLIARFPVCLLACLPASLRALLQLLCCSHSTLIPRS